MLPRVQLQSADEVWARIDEIARADGRAGVVATDGDGTLWSGDVGEDLFFAFVDHGESWSPRCEALRREAREHALSDAGTGRTSRGASTTPTSRAASPRSACAS